MNGLVLNPACLLAVDSGGAGGFAGGAGGNWIAGVGGCWKRVRLNKNTPPAHQYFRGRKSKSSHDLTIEDGKGQPTPKRWKRLRVGDGRDRPLIDGGADTLGLRPVKMPRDAVPDKWDAKRSASG